MERTHLIVYAAPVTRRMLHFNGLDYYSIPALPETFKIPTWLKIQLGIFAGRLYFEFEEHHDMLAYLGVRTSSSPKSEHPTQPSGFAKNPLTFRKTCPFFKRVSVY